MKIRSRTEFRLDLNHIYMYMVFQKKDNFKHIITSKTTVCETTVCVKDGGPHIVFMRLKLYLKVYALIFYVCEGSSQAIANELNMQKLWYQYFLTMKATVTIFDTQ